MVSGSRMYAVNQEKLPSVTSILQATQSEEKKASLANWKARVGAAEANRIKNDASSRGTSMHAFLEKYLLGQLNLELLEEDNKSKKMADEIIEQGIKGKLSEIFGTDARSITRTLENIKDPEQVEKAVQTENVEKFVDHSKQAKN